MYNNEKPFEIIKKYLLGILLDLAIIGLPLLITNWLMPTKEYLDMGIAAGYIYNSFEDRAPIFIVVLIIELFILKTTGLWKTALYPFTAYFKLLKSISTRIKNLFFSSDSKDQ